MSKRLLLTIVFLVATAYWCAAQHTYYISKALGDDSRTSTQAQSPSTPWQHVPGMSGCTTGCAAVGGWADGERGPGNGYVPVAGDRFILRGGDRWVAADLGMEFESSGTSSSHIYIGVDPSFYAGAIWSRPIFDCQNTPCNSTRIIRLWGSYITVDNIEFTSQRHTAAVTEAKGVEVFNNYIEVENCYFHAWSVDAGAPDNGRDFAISGNASYNSLAGTSFHDNVVDGIDSTQNAFGGAEVVESVYNNVIRYVYNGIHVNANYIYNNWLDHMVDSWSGQHNNFIAIFAPLSGNRLYSYNNVMTGISGMGMWLEQTNGNCPTCITYAFNNVLLGRPISIGGHPADGTNYGAFYVYNNTIYPGWNNSGAGSCIENGEGPTARSTTYYSNNHCIDASICLGIGTTCVNNGTNLVQTAVQANANIAPHFDQYTASQTYIDSPVAATNSTVGAGTNYSTFCDTMGNTAARAACKNDIDYLTYDTVNHKVVHARSPSPRNATWDIGAYQYAVSGPLAVATASLPSGTQYQPYSQTLQASGGTPPYSWSVVSGSLSPLTLNSAGVISGTPSIATTLNFTARVTDSVNATADKPLSIIVAAAPPLAVSTSSLPTAAVGSAYSQTLQAAGGHPAYNWDLLSGSLPTNLSLATNGNITGIPTTPGTSNFTVRVTDQSSNTATQPLSINVTNCTTSSGTWQSIPFGSQSGIFTAQWDATPSLTTLNDLMSLSAAPATGYGDMAAAARFYTDGTINALHDAGLYAGSIAYLAGQTYHFRLQVNVPSHTYSVFVTPPSSAEQTLASNINFRDTQMSIGSLAYLNLYEASGSGSVQVCNFALGSNSAAIQQTSNTTDLITGHQYALTRNISNTFTTVPVATTIISLSRLPGETLSASASAQGTKGGPASTLCVENMTAEEIASATKGGRGYVLLHHCTPGP